MNTIVILFQIVFSLFFVMRLNARLPFGELRST